MNTRRLGKSEKKKGGLLVARPLVTTGLGQGLGSLMAYQIEYGLANLVSILRLPCRILNMYLVQPENGTRMETTNR